MAMEQVGFSTAFCLQLLSHHSSICLSVAHLIIILNVIQTVLLLVTFTADFRIAIGKARMN